MTPDLQKVLTACSLDAERSVIGAVFLRPEAYYQVELSSADFFHPAHREIWRAFERLTAAEKPVDLVAVELELERAGLLQAVGGLSVVAELLTTVPTADNIAFYAEEVRDAALKRRVAQATLTALASNATGEEYQAAVLAAASAVEVRQRDGQSFGAVVGDAFRHIGQVEAARREGTGASWGIPTGFPDLDHLLGGLEPGSVTFIGGRTSRGKSAWLRQVLISIAQAGHGVHWFSPEDKALTIGVRALADTARIDLHRLRSGDLTPENGRALAGAHDDLARLDRLIHVDDTRGLSSAQIAHRVRRHSTRLKTRVVGVDYLQLLSEPGAWNRKNEVDRAVLGIARMAERESVAALVATQLSREAMHRDDARPRLSDLKESGDLENNATNVLLIHMTDEMKANGQAQIDVAKQKNGRTGIVDLIWDGDCTAFRSREIHRPDYVQPDRAYGDWRAGAHDA